MTTPYDFYIHTYNNDPTNILAGIAKYHPAARAILISDGDGVDWNTPYFHKFDQKLSDRSTAYITRWWDLTRTYESDVIVRIDVDVRMHRPFTKQFPIGADFFGSIVRWRHFDEEKTSIHCKVGQFFTKNFVDTLYGQINDGDLLKREFMYRDSLISVDKILAHLAKINNVPLVEYSEVTHALYTPVLGVIPKFAISL